MDGLGLDGEAVLLLRCRGGERREDLVQLADDGVLLPHPGELLDRRTGGMALFLVCHPARQGRAGRRDVVAQLPLPAVAGQSARRRVGA